MKRIITVALLGLLFSPLAKAQVFTFGPKAGFNFTQFEIAGDVNPDLDITSIEDGRKTGFTAGAFMQLNLGPLNFQPEFMFAQDAANLAFRDVSFGDFAKVNFNRLDVPLLMGLNFGKVVRIQAGPVMTYVLDVDVEQGAGALVETFVNDFDSNRWGYQVGGGLDLGRLALDVRWGGGFGTRAVEIDVNGQPQVLDLKRQSIQATLGINIIK
jgi:hypothetical protein